MIDTGGSISLIAKHCVTSWNLLDKSIDLSAANQQSIALCGVADIQFQFAHTSEVFIHRFVVVESIMYDVILGADFLALHQGNINFQSNQLHLNLNSQV